MSVAYCKGVVVNRRVVLICRWICRRICRRAAGIERLWVSLSDELSLTERSQTVLTQNMDSIATWFLPVLINMLGNTCIDIDAHIEGEDPQKIHICIAHCAQVNRLL